MSPSAEKIESDSLPEGFEVIETKSLADIKNEQKYDAVYFVKGQYSDFRAKEEDKKKMCVIKLKWNKGAEPQILWYQYDWDGKSIRFGSGGDYFSTILGDSNCLEMLQVPEGFGENKEG